MIYLGAYEELSPGKGYPSIKDSFSDSPYYGQQKIIQYLKNGTKDMVSARIPIDVITGEPIKMNMIGMNDGEFTWWNTLAYYVEKYNLRLPKNFEEKVINAKVDI